MKMVEGIIQPQKLDEVKSALLQTGVQGMTVSKAEGFTRDHTRKEVYRSATITVDFVPMVKVQAVVEDDLLEQALNAIESSAKTGHIGDGKVFVWDVGQALRIRTGETGEDAVHRDIGTRIGGHVAVAGGI